MYKFMTLFTYYSGYDFPTAHTYRNGTLTDSLEGYIDRHLLMFVRYASSRVVEEEQVRMWVGALYSLPADRISLAQLALAVS